MSVLRNIRRNSQNLLHKSRLLFEIPFRLLPYFAIDCMITFFKLMKRIRSLGLGLFAIAIMLIIQYAQADFKDVERWTGLGIATTELQEQGIIEGFSGNVFLPDKAVSRAAFTKMVTSVVFKEKEIENCIADGSFGYSNTVGFRDIPVSEWYAPYVCTAKKKGLINGYPDKTFRPEQNVSYAEAAKIVVEGIGKKISGEGEWYKQYLSALGETGALKNIDFNPFEPITRGDTALILYHLFFTKNAPYNAESEPSPVASDATSTGSATPSASPTHLSSPDTNFTRRPLPRVDFAKDSCAEAIAKVFPDTLQAKDCFRNEMYDLTRQTCVRNCDRADECARIDAEAAAITADIFDLDLSQRIANDSFYSYTPFEITHYTVDNFRLTDRKNSSVPADLRSMQTDTAAHAAIWSAFITTFPLEYLASITEFVVFSDGIGGIASDTRRISEASEASRFRYDPADSSDLYFTLAHEYGHLIALSAYEDLVGLVAHTCAAQDFANKAAMRDSYLKEFRARFWESYGDAYLALDEMDDGLSRQRLSEALGRRYRDHFLTDYSLTNSEEDFAESFAVFIFTEYPDRREPAYDKVRFFYEYPYLTRLRAAIRWALVQQNQDGV